MIFALLAIDGGFFTVAGDAEALQVGRFEPGSAIGDGLNVIHLVGRCATACAKGVGGKLPFAEFLPGAIIAALGGGKFPWRFLALWEWATMYRPAQDHG